MEFENTFAFAQKADNEDPLKKFRSKFYIPILHGKESIYFSGNSLGLQPKTTQDLVVNELEDWANYAKEARQHGRKPWMSYHDDFPKRLAPILGALPEEVVAMNQLTSNLHLMLATFYRPDRNRYKIVYEENAFSSDIYALKSHIKMAGLREEDALVKVRARPGAMTLHHEDILSAISECGDSLALVMFGGVNYLTGQAFDISAITGAAHAVGAKCGWDLAHAAGNIQLQLNNWQVDFAVWCGYKYFNSGPGAIGGAFVHKNHHSDPSLLRLAGWWGNDKQSRFRMAEDFVPSSGAEGWQLSGPSILNLAMHEAALEVFYQANFKRVVEKSRKLSAWLIFVMNDVLGGTGNKNLEMITPQEPESHGSQLSFLVKKDAAHLGDMLRRNGIIADIMADSILRIAPVPLYNTYEEVYTFGQILKNILKTDPAP